MLDLGTLNPEQRQAVEDFEGPMLILAGAGTGKTRVITYRIAHMIQCGIKPESIVALSFTNKAAREMAERVRDIGGERASRAWLGTFHSFCLNILRSYSKEANLPRRFGLIGTSDQLDLVRKALAERNWDGLYNADELLQHISRAKNHIISPEELESSAAFADSAEANLIATVYELYERQLRLNRVIDFDDCIYKCVRLLAENESARESLRAQYKFLLVDEFQDTNSAQLAVLSHLASSDHHVCVVGDDDQSIYSWRGAVYEILDQFESLFPGTKLVKLEQNYRCTKVILDAANEVIRNNSQRKDKTLWSSKASDRSIELFPRPDDKDEAEWIATKVIAHLGSGGKPGDVAVLYRANAQARQIELSLRESRIPYKTFGGQSFFERKEVKDFLAYLRLVFNHRDHLALWRIINTPNRGIGLKTLERIEEQALAKRVAPYECIRSNESFLDGRAAKSVESFKAIIDELAALPIATPEQVEALGESVLKLSGLMNEIKQKSPNSAARDRKLANLRSLPGWLRSVAEDLTSDGKPFKPDDFIDLITLDRDKKDKDEEQGQYVSLMTMHAAKGLEFPIVFVVGLEEELLPHRNSIQDPRAVCEERRLFYVAITRAKEQLYLSYCNERAGTFGKSEKEPSRFLAELPTDTVKEDRDAQLNPEIVKTERKKNTLSTLSQLRASLK